jgi:CubicO group peptidase (beta-lactamase class C family)
VITEHKPDSLPIGAYGWSGAYGTHFWVDPINQIVGVYMKNSRYDGGAGCRTSQNFENDVYASLRG